MLFDTDKYSIETEAIVDGDGHRVSYGDVLTFEKEFSSAVGGRCLIAVITENAAGAFLGYAACLENRIVPLMLSHTLADEAVQAFADTYHPSFFWVPEEMRENYPYEDVFRAYGYVLLKTGISPYEMYDDLSLLLPTSGSTGVPKLVRHSYENVVSNARAVAAAFELDPASRGMVSLPLNFTQGLNVASSHFIAGGTILLTRAGLTDRAFWSFFKEEHAQSFTGVPYSYELLNKLRFFRMNLPDLKIINQGGGRMPDDLFETCANYAAETGRKFIATYGSTETTSRMTYLPAEYACSKTGSIGIPFPGREVLLLDDEGNEISTPGMTGEIIYKGPNVTLGYAEKGDDLLLGDERNGVYATGDLAIRDEDGCYFIQGRKNRFLKLYGIRIGLDETERMLKSALGIECACVGDDKQMRVYVTDAAHVEEIMGMLRDRFSVPKSAFEVIVLDELPKNETGKVQYKMLK